MKTNVANFLIINLNNKTIDDADWHENSIIINHLVDDWNDKKYFHSLPKHESKPSNLIFLNLFNGKRSWN